MFKVVSAVMYTCGGAYIPGLYSTDLNAVSYSYLHRCYLEKHLKTTANDTHASAHEDEEWHEQLDHVVTSCFRQVNNVRRLVQVLEWAFAF